MRRFAALILALTMTACTTADNAFRDLSPNATAPVQNAAGNPRFGDRDPHEWASIPPWRYAIHGTDVSKYQKSIEWPKARASGISFAFIKATEGGDRVDDYFAEHWRGAKAAGIARGAYHFYYFCRTAAEQAAWFIQNVPREAGAMPPVLDMEWNHLSPTCKLRPAPETVRSEMRIFLDIVARHYGKRPIIYTTIDFFDRNGLASLHGYPYWLRSTAGHPTEKYGSHPFVFWQYTGTGIVPGINGDADINVFNGTASSWRAWLKANAR